MERAILVVSTMAIILPISMQRDMADLAKTSKISVIFQCCMVVVVVIFSPVSETLEQNGGLVQIASESVIRCANIYEVGFCRNFIKLGSLVKLLEYKL